MNEGGCRNDSNQQVSASTQRSVVSSANERYRHGDVVDALLQMQHAKCCYCEIYIADSGVGKQVEHFRPQSQFRNLRYSWDNLLLACAECNHAKSDQFPEFETGGAVLLDPSDPDTDPEDHIGFIVNPKRAGGWLFTVVQNYLLASR